MDVLELLLQGQPLIDIQAEKGEEIGWPDGSLTPVHAKRTHAAMDNAGDENLVTDSLPPPTYIFSDFLRIKREDVADMNVGEIRYPYHERKKGKEPEVQTVEDVIFKKRQRSISPAKAARNVKSKFKVLEGDDPLTRVTNAENRKHRLPYLEAIASLSEVEKNLVESQKAMGEVEYLPLYKFGGALHKDDIDKYIFGGIGKFLKGAGKAAVGGLKAVADTALTPLGAGSLIDSQLDRTPFLRDVLGGVGDVVAGNLDIATNLALGADIIKDGAFQTGLGRQISGDVGRIANSIGDIAVPIAASAFLGPGAAAAVSGVRGVTNGLNDGQSFGQALQAGIGSALASGLGAQALGNTGGFGNIPGNLGNIAKLFSNGNLATTGLNFLQGQSPLNQVLSAGNVGVPSGNSGIAGGIDPLGNVVSGLGSTIAGIAGGTGAGIFSPALNQLQGLNVGAGPATTFGNVFNSNRTLFKKGGSPMTKEGVTKFQVIGNTAAGAPIGTVFPTRPPIAVPTIPTLPTTPVSPTFDPTRNRNPFNNIPGGVSVNPAQGGQSILDVLTGVVTSVLGSNAQAAPSAAQAAPSAAQQQFAQQRNILASDPFQLAAALGLVGAGAADIGIQIANTNRVRNAFDTVGGLNNQFITTAQDDLRNFADTSQGFINDRQVLGDDFFTNRQELINPFIDRLQGSLGLLDDNLANINQLPGLAEASGAVGLLGALGASVPSARLRANTVQPSIDATVDAQNQQRASQIANRNLVLNSVQDPLARANLLQQIPGFDSQLGLRIGDLRSQEANFGIDAFNTNSANSVNDTRNFFTNIAGAAQSGINNQINTNQAVFNATRDNILTGNSIAQNIFGVQDGNNSAQFDFNLGINGANQALVNTLFDANGNINATALNLLSQTELDRTAALNQQINQIPAAAFRLLAPILSQGRPIVV